MPEKLAVVVLISGNGSNLQAIIDKIKTGLPVDIKAVISNRPHAFGLQRAAQAQIPTDIVDHQQFPGRSAFEAALADCIDRYQPQLIVLAGFMRKLGVDFVRHYEGRMINIHPSLLPKYPGLNTHQRALDANDQEHGISIHYVNEQVDGGPIICQAKLAIQAHDNATSLKARTQTLEHQTYPQVLDWIARGRLTLKNKQVIFDGKTLKPSGIDTIR